MNRQSGSTKIIIILVVGSLFAAGLYWFRPKPKTRPPTDAKPPIVSVISVQPQAQQIYVSTQGTVMPSREISLVAEVSGRVVSASEHFVNGGFFNEKDTMITLDSRDYEYRLAEAVAQVAGAERELALEKGQARQAKREWRDLGSEEANALSLRIPQVKAAEAQLLSAIAQRNQAQLNVERASIRAPFRGRVQTTNANVGQYVTAGTVIASIYDDALAEVRLPLTDKQLALIGLPLGVTLPENQKKAVTLSATLAGKTYQWPAKITRTEASVDATTRLYFAVAEIPEPFDTHRYQAPLITGLFVEAKVSGITFTDVVSIPESAILKNRFVYIVDNNNRLQQRDIHILANHKNAVWITGDIKKDEKLVISDPKVLGSDMLVMLKDNP
jgi:RND family efflux transporter MFP subunit